MRKGKLSISYDFNTNTVQISDNYDYTGTALGDDNITFNASTLIVADCIMIVYKNTNTNDTTLVPSKFTYSYSALS
jgi:hypothetical protein